jgi:hypothetical protein
MKEKGQKQMNKSGGKKDFFLLERPNLFAVCNNTFGKWWEG